MADRPPRDSRRAAIGRHVGGAKVLIIGRIANHLATANRHAGTPTGVRILVIRHILPLVKRNRIAAVAVIKLRQPQIAGRVVRVRCARAIDHISISNRSRDERLDVVFGVHSAIAL